MSRHSQKGRSYSEVKGKRWVAIYRAVDADEFYINQMDYVTLSRKFAIGHAEHEAAVDDQDQHVLYTTVKAEHVFEAPNPGEWFYDGPRVRARRIKLVKAISGASSDIPKELISKRVYKDRGYEVRTEMWDPEGRGGDKIEMKSAYSLPEGYYIGDPKKAHHLWKKYGITRWELSDPENTVASIGWSPSKQKWFGWSHRAIWGYKPGQVMKKGDIGVEGGDGLGGPGTGSFPAGYEIKDFDDARRAAVEFAKCVAHAESALYPTNSLSAAPRPNVVDFAEYKRACNIRKWCELGDSFQRDFTTQNRVEDAVVDALKAASGERWYTGLPRKLSTFTTDHVGTGNDQLGPGLYFASEPSIASAYGAYIHECEIKWRKKLNPYAKASKKLIAFLLDQIPDWSAENDHYWGERTPEEAKRNLFSSLTSGQNNIEAISLLPTSTLYYSRNTPKLLENLVKAGYTGFVVPAGSTSRGPTSNEDDFAVVFDPKAVKVVNVMERNKLKGSAKPAPIRPRSGGRGTQNDADRVRNYWYDTRFRRASLVAELRAVASSLSASKPRFSTYAEALDWIEQKTREYGGKGKFTSSQEYKEAWPEIDELYKREKKAKPSKATYTDADLEKAGLSYGDRVEMTFFGLMMTQAKATGVLVKRGGKPQVKLDSPLTVGKNGRLTNRKFIEWTPVWKKK